MPVTKFHVAIFASGSGSNAEAIAKYFNGHPFITIDLIVTNNPNAPVLQRASRLDIPAKILTREKFQEEADVLWLLNEYQITHIVLAGFLLLIPRFLISAYPDKIINIHPSLLPKFGGKGMFGMNVHQAVKNAFEKETGITIHLVNEQFDKGEILFQEKCTIEEHDVPADIARCVQKLEYEHYPRVIEQWIVGEKSRES
jgi:phosphoribosylglycinamide formyltransferase-1